MLKKFIPNEYVNSIMKIDFLKLYESGYKLILTDLDNTIISYISDELSNEFIELIEKLKKIGFEIIIVSNSRRKRVSEIASKLKIKYVKLAMKPTKIGLKRAIKLANNKYNKSEILEIGDQIMTDVLASKRLGIYSILVQAIDNKTEGRSTRFNRFLEKIILNKIKKKYNDIYMLKLNDYAKEHYDL